MLTGTHQPHLTGLFNRGLEVCKFARKRFPGWRALQCFWLHKQTTRSICKGPKRNGKGFMLGAPQAGPSDRLALGQASSRRLHEGKGFTVGGPARPQTRRTLSQKLCGVF